MLIEDLGKTLAAGRIARDQRATGEQVGIPTVPGRDPSNFSVLFVSFVASFLQSGVSVTSVSLVPVFSVSTVFSAVTA